MRMNSFYTNVNAKLVCMTVKELDTDKCRRDVFPTPIDAEREIKQLTTLQGYKRVSVKEFEASLQPMCEICQQARAVDVYDTAHMCKSCSSVTRRLARTGKV